MHTTLLAAIQRPRLVNSRPGLAVYQHMLYRYRLVQLMLDCTVPSTRSFLEV